MARRFGLACTAICLLLLASCHRAERFPAALPVAKEEAKKDELSPRLRWVEPSPRREVPLLFVADTSDEWASLPGFWTVYPLIPLHLAQPPLPALAGIVVRDQIRAIKIKVPRGLPDPTRYFPPSNPPTLEKWQLGKELFHKRMLRSGAEVYACASCHDPRRGFADGRTLVLGGKRNTLSLVNVAYNRRQFWDGRVRTLEETLVRSLDDERKLDDAQSQALTIGRHVWGGFVRGLADLKDFQLDERFRRASGVPHPTQDAAAQALATYMRTILAGDSLFDRAARLRRDQQAPAFTAEHFRELLRDDIAAALVSDGIQEKPKRDALPALAVEGYELFHGKARCATCHVGPLFTDHDYHNVGYLKAFGAERAEGAPPEGVETGRAVHVPIGLKESRLIGAFRTPSLRNLARTDPYFHDGSLATLPRVVDFFDQNVQPTPHLAKALKDGDLPMRLRLSQPESDALVVFLRTLVGRAVDPIVAELPK